MRGTLKIFRDDVGCHLRENSSCICVGREYVYSGAHTRLSLVKIKSRFTTQVRGLEIFVNKGFLFLSPFKDGSCDGPELNVPVRSPNF